MQRLDVPSCPYCGKQYPNLRFKEKKESKERIQQQHVNISNDISFEDHKIQSQQVYETPQLQTYEPSMVTTTFICNMYGANERIWNAVRDCLKELPIEEMNLSVRAFNCLKRADVNTVADLTEMTVESLRKVRNFGNKSTEEVTQKLREMGIHLAEKEWLEYD